MKCKEDADDTGMMKKQDSSVSDGDCSPPKAARVGEVNQSHPTPYNTTAPRNVPVPKTLYRRPLPESCIPFASEEGKTIFREALATGHMNCYFRLASQFRTQDEPAYCGLATLIMVLNALEIDPGRVWKGPWKWYHEDMLDCCVSTEIVRKQGITFDEFICLADCNALDTDAFRVDESSREERFRALVKDMTVKEDTFLVLSYSRPALGQTGDGHFAPVSGYHPGRDLVLILDTARFKYPPHWIPLSLLFESMKALDMSTGLPRGYVQLWPAKDSKALLLFKIAKQFSVNASPEIMENHQAFMSAWTQLISTPTSKAEGTDVLSAVVDQTLQGLVKVSSTLNKDMFVLTTQEHIRCTNACNVQCIIRDLLSQLESTDMFKTVCQQVTRMSVHNVQRLQSIFGFWPNVDVVDSGSVKLAEPVSVIDCGSVKLAESVSAIDCGSVKLAESVSAIDSGSVKLAESVSAIDSGSVKLAESVSAIDSGSVKLAESVSAIGSVRQTDPVSVIGCCHAKQADPVSVIGCCHAKQADPVSVVDSASVKQSDPVSQKEATGSQKTACCDMNQKLCLCHFVTGFLLCWPYSSIPDPAMLGTALHGLVQEALMGPRRQFLKDEMTTCLRQLKKLISYHSAEALSKVGQCCSK